MSKEKISDARLNELIKLTIGRDTKKALVELKILRNYTLLNTPRSA